MISSVIFGIGHIFGELGSSALTVICKVIWTIGLGLYLGAIYIKHLTGGLFCTWPFCYSTIPPYPEASLSILLAIYIIVGGYGFI